MNRVFADHGKKKFAMGLEVVLARISWLGAFAGETPPLLPTETVGTLSFHTGGGVMVGRLLNAKLHSTGQVCFPRWMLSRMAMTWAAASRMAFQLPAEMSGLGANHEPPIPPTSGWLSQVWQFAGFTPPRGIYFKLRWA